ncbi:MAG: hypothetical protein WC389_05425 [Lutibacter sp.]|jgi:hypothetical protein
MPEKTKTTQLPAQNNTDKEITDLLSGYNKELDITENKETISETQEVPEPKKETRGRKPGSKKTKIFAPEPEPLKTLAASDLISGALFLLFIDLLIPSIFVFANNRFSKKKIKVDKLRLTENQKNQLEPLANEAAKQIMLKGNPVTVFAFALISIYGLNFMMLKNE